MNLYYNANGSFGKVRAISRELNADLKNIYTSSVSFGWHECNNKYSITRENGANNWLLFFTVKGNGYFESKDKINNLAVNSVAIVPPNLYHKYGAVVQDDGIWEFFWVHIDGEWAANTLTYIMEQKGESFKISSMAKIVELMERLIFFNINSYNDHIENSLIITKILYVILNDILVTDITSSKGNEIIQKSIKYIEINYNTDIKLTKAAAEMFVTPEHLIRIFKKAVGDTPYNYLIKYRIMKSCELLKYTDMPIKTIANEIGFKSVSSFIKKFKEVKKTTPNKYRNSFSNSKSVNIFQLYHHNGKLTALISQPTLHKYSVRLTHGCIG